MARLQSTAEMFRVAIQETAEQTHRALVQTAKREHARVMTAHPRPSSFLRTVDGQQNLPEEAAKPFGVIHYLYHRIDEVAQFAMETLYDLSPVLSGEYRNAHTLFLNGTAVANLADWESGDEVSITNYVPYSRKIEVGAMKMRVPGTDHVYQQATRKVRARYGNIANIEFTYRGIVGGAQVNPALAAPALKRSTLVNVHRADGRVTTGKRTVNISGGEHNKANVRFPVMIIRER